MMQRRKHPMKADTVGGVRACVWGGGQERKVGEVVKAHGTEQHPRACSTPAAVVSSTHATAVHGSANATHARWWQCR